MDQFGWIWCLIFISSQGLSYGFIYTSWPIINPMQDTFVAVNKKIILSCKVHPIDNSTSEISMFLNEILIMKRNSYIEYELTSDKPVRYKFKCKSHKSENFVSIIFRYMPQVVSMQPVITNQNICHMVVSFTFAHFRTMNDYAVIKGYERNNKEVCSSTRSDSNNDILESNPVKTCQLNCSFFINYIFQVNISSKDFQNSKVWKVQANETFYLLQKLNAVHILATNRENVSLSYRVENYNNRIFNSNYLYRIIYKSEWDKTAKNVTTDQTEIVLQNLVPYTTYTIDVQAKLKKSIYWNEKLTFKTKTLSSAPYAGPQSTNGSFMETTCGSKLKRCFVFYWAMIPMHLRNGNLSNYVIQQNGNILNETSGLFIEINDQPRNKDLWFEIRANMTDSLKSPPTVMHIPPKAPHKPKDICVVRLNSTHFNVSWDLHQQPLENITVTVMSCLGKKPGSTLWCMSNVKWTETRNANFTILKATNATNFAAYVSTSEGSSSLTVAECILTKGISRTPRQAIISKKSATRLNLLWPTYNCKDLNGKPILFQVLYAAQNTCINGLEKNIAAIGTRPETENIEIKNLKPFSNYTICLRVYTVQGWSKMSPQLTISTLESIPSSSVRNLQFVNINVSSVTLKWDPVLQANGIITSYLINYTKSDGTSQQIFTKASNRATIFGLEPLTRYNFVVSACNKAGCSKKSANLTASTLIGNLPRLDVRLKPQSESQLQIQWNLPVFWRNYLQYYRLELIYNKKSFHYNVTKEEYNGTILCPSSEENIIVMVKVWAVIKYGNSLIYGDTTRQSQFMCSKKINLWLIITISILSSLIFFVICGCAAQRTYWKYKDTDIVIRLPDIVPNLPWYAEVKFDSQTKLMYSKSGPISIPVEEESETKTKITLLEKNTKHLSKESLTKNYFHQKISSKAEKQNEKNLDAKLDMPTFCPSIFDSNGYAHTDILLSDSNHHENHPNALSPELNQLPLDSSNHNSRHCFKESELDFEGYQHEDFFRLNKSNSDAYLSYQQDNVALSDLNHAHRRSKGDVQNNTKLSVLSQTNSETNGYVQNNVKSSGSSQADSETNGYVQNNMKSSGSSQADSETNGYVQNNVKSSGSSQADSETNGYVQNIMSSEANSETNHYIEKQKKTLNHLN